MLAAVGRVDPLGVVAPPAAEVGFPSSLSARFLSASGAWICHVFNGATAVTLAALGWIPWLSAAGFLLMLIDLADGTLRPALGARPTQIGLRQLLASTLFAFLSVIGFALESV